VQFLAGVVIGHENALVYGGDFYATLARLDTPARLKAYFACGALG